MIAMVCVRRYLECYLLIGVALLVESKVKMREEEGKKMYNALFKELRNLN